MTLLAFLLALSVAAVCISLGIAYYCFRVGFYASRKPLPEGAFDLPEGKDCTLVLRPESAVLADSGVLPCKVIVSCFMGSYQNYHVMVGDTLVKITDYNPRNKNRCPTWQ